MADFSGIRNAQDIPISVSVLTSESLTNRGVYRIDDLVASVPGLSVTPAPQGRTTLRIRGLGTGSGSESVDQSIGLFIDGVWAGRSRELQAALFDLDRVEVIKGTQTSQLGKNASLGAIQVFSKRSEEETGGYIESSYEFEFDSVQVSGAANLASDAGNYRFAFNYVDEQGYVKNGLTGGEGPNREQLGFRLSGVWELGDKSSLFATYSYDDLEIEGDPMEVFGDSPGVYTALTGDTDVTLNGRSNSYVNRRSDGRTFDEQDSQRVVLEFTHELSEETSFISVSGYSQYENNRDLDSDFSQLNFLEQRKEFENKQFTQEFRIESNAWEDTLQYAAGVFYFNNEFELFEDLVTEDVFPFVPVGPFSDAINYEYEVEALAAFFHGTYNLTDRIDASIGMRYTDESRDVVWSRTVLADGGYHMDWRSSCICAH